MPRTKKAYDAILPHTRCSADLAQALQKKAIELNKSQADLVREAVYFYLHRSGQKLTKNRSELGS